MSVLWLILLTLALAFAQAVVFKLCDMKKLTYDRYFAQNTGYEGQRIELLETIRNAKPLPVPWLKAESRIPKELAFEKEKSESSDEVSGGLYHRSLFFLAPMSAVTRHHEVTLKHRGVYNAGSVALTAGDLFSLAHSESERDCTCVMTVYPAILSESELPDPANRWLGEAVVRRWIMPDPFLVNGIRAYAAGDSLKDVHWKASARTGELRVKVHDYTSDPKALVILNIQSSEYQWADVPPQDEEMMEQGIRIAATLCMRALRNGMNAGFATNAALPGSEGKGRCVYVAGDAGSGQQERLLTAMAQIKLRRELNFHTFLDELDFVTGEDILIISAYTTEDVEKAVFNLRAQGNTVSVLRLERGRCA